MEEETSPETKKNPPIVSVSKLDFMKLRRDSADKMARNTNFPDAVRSKFIEKRKMYDKAITQLSKNS